MPRHELSGVRPSRLSGLFRGWAEPGGPLADWTRHIDGDWQFYCPRCAHITLIVEEKSEASPAKSWAVTRRLATGHEDKPWGWRVTCLGDGAFSVVGARGGERHESFAEKRIDELELLRWIVRVFEQHYEEAGHPRAVAA